MGFKCPICLKDFKINKYEWSEHIKTKHEGLGEDCVNVLKNITKKDEG